MIFLIFLCLIVFGVLMLIYSGWVEPNAFEINEHTISHQKDVSSPVKILHLSDIHFARARPSLTRFFKRLAKIEVDFVFLTGDIIDCTSGIPLCIDHLKMLKPKYGIFAVFGNHDYYDYKVVDAFIHNLKAKDTHPIYDQPIDEFTKKLQKIGVTVLKNESRKVELENGDVLLIHGLDDPATGHDDASLIHPNIDRGKLNLLLTHLVDAVLNFEKGRIDVSFSGHSHGGQINFPIVGAPITHTQMGKRFISGVQDQKGTKCVISRGLGAGRSFFLRLQAPTEAILVNLKRA